MKLFRFRRQTSIRPGIITPSGIKRDVSDFVEDYDERFFGSGGIARLRENLDKNHSQLPIVEDDVPVAAPLIRPSKIVCVGLNYKKHAEELDMPIPKDPVLFTKATSALSGPYDPVIIPKNSFKTDWEVELAVIIGKQGSYLTEEDAVNHIAGYALFNDVSERAFQMESGGQWVKGKSANTFAPLGPYIATPDEIPNPDDLHIWLKINGQIVQDSHTSDMIFSVPYLVAYISQFMTLIPGDIISTGTPSGVGFGLKPPRYLQPGDIMELGIEGLGVARQQAVAYDDLNRF